MERGKGKDRRRQLITEERGVSEVESRKRCVENLRRGKMLVRRDRCGELVVIENERRRQKTSQSIEEECMFWRIEVTYKFDVVELKVMLS